MEIIEEGGFQYVEGGAGEPIVVLHGLFGALSNFDAVFQHFSKNYKVIIPVMPLYDMAVINTNVKNLAKFLKKFLDYKGLDKVNLLGNSLGGHVALVFSKSHPERVNSMVLTGSSGLYENAFGGSFPRRGDREYIRKKVEITFYDPETATEELVDKCFEIINNRNNVLRILALAKSAIRHNMEKDLPNYKMPVCLIWGKNDEITPPHVAEEFHAKLPKSDLFWIDKCGHAAMMEHPEEFNSILSPWYEDLFAGRK